jgi:hypothetical protein
MASAIASTPTLVYQGSLRKSYGQLRYIHKSSEKAFVAWVTSHSKFLQNLSGTISLYALEREFYRIDERLPRNIVDELVAIVDAREKAKVIHIRDGTHDDGHENCLQMYKYFLRRANKENHSPSPSSPPSPKPGSEEDFPSLGSSTPPPSSPPSPKPSSHDHFPSLDSPSPVQPTRGNSMKRRFSAAAIHPVAAATP